MVNTGHQSGAAFFIQFQAKWIAGFYYVKVGSYQPYLKPSWSTWGAVSRFSLLLASPDLWNNKDFCLPDPVELGVTNIWWRDLKITKQS